MANFRDRYDPLRLFLKRLATAGLFVVVLLVGSGVWRLAQKERESQILRQQAEAQRADLEKQAAALQDETTKLQTDRGKEEILREQYDMGRQGEGLIVIVDPESPQPVATSTTFLQKVKKLFFW